MKKIGFKYFFLLFIAVLSCFGVYTKSIQNTGKIFSPYVVNHHEFNSDRKQHLSQGSLAYEVEYENVEISESEVEDSEFETSFFDAIFFSKFLNNCFSFNFIYFVKNGLKDCFFGNYLSSIQSFNVLFCVYRL